MIFNTVSERDYKTRREVVKTHPGAARIVKVTGGWAVFYSLADYETWKRQK